jgi:hypothetical protein
VTLLLNAAGKLQRPELRLIALSVLEQLDEMAQTGHLSHVYDGSGPVGPPEVQLLADWAQLLNALLDAASYAGVGERYLPRARAVAASMMTEFHDGANGGFFEVASDAEAIGYLRVREKPLPENVAAAQGLLKLHQATGDPDYREVARRTLSAYVEANRIYGEFAASYALTVDLMLNQPIEIAIEGHPANPKTQDLLRAAAQAPYPHLVVKLVDAPAGNRPLAHVCSSTVCLPPVGDPAELAMTIAEAAAPQAGPLENIFQQLGSD